MKDDPNFGRLSPTAVAAALQVKNAVVIHDEFKQIMDGGRAAVELADSIKVAGGIIALAEPGMGKTLLIKLIEKILMESISEGESNRPILRIELDSNVDVYSIATKMTYAVGFPMLPTRSSLINMNGMIERALGNLRPRALLIDESQHMCEGNRSITARSITDWLKVLMDKFNMPVLCFGTKTFELIGAINPQFTSRLSQQYEIKAFNNDEKWRQFEAAFMQQITIVGANILGTNEISRKCHAASRGNMRRYKKLMMNSCISAVTRGVSVLEEVDLWRGYQAAFAGVPEANPFKSK
ncbi:MAG: TniB family NTP-binding protein [Hylemonella sp.]|uniref:TniB family NTP-binding protein n=1 Tax=Hylemonella sp. TaxID=2066020 RepID=UPI003919C486